MARILLASDAFAPKIDGVADTSGHLVRLLRARGHEVEVVAPAPGPDSFEGATVHRQRSVGLPFYNDVRATIPFRSISTVVQRFRPEAAVILTPGPIGVATVRALPARTRLVNIYTTDIPTYLRAYHMGLAAPLVERLLLWLNRRAVVTLCPTEIVRRSLADRGMVRLRIWSRGVDHDLFNPGRQCAEMRFRLTGGQPELPLVLYAGRLAREKRLDDLYHAAQRMPGTRFAIVGDGPQREVLERKFANVPSVFTGFLRGTPLAEAFASADVFAFPSDSETFGQVVLQSLASGTPAVVVEGTAPAEFVPHGIAGLHIPPRNPRELGEALTRITSDETLRGHLSQGAASTASSYSWAALVETLERDYLQVQPSESPDVRPSEDQLLAGAGA